MGQQPHILHILLFNQYYPPDTAATANVTQAIAKTLANHCRVIVLAGRPSYDPVCYHPWYLFKRVLEGNIVVERVGSIAYQRHQMRWRVMNYLSYLVLAIPRALTADANLIIAMTDPPLVGVAAALVARLRHRPFVYSIQDLHPDMALASGLVRPGLLVCLWEKLHRWALRQADRVTALGEDMRQRIIGKGVKPKRVVVVRTGASVPESLPSHGHPVAQEIRRGFTFVVVHAGNIGFYGAWKTLIEGIRLLDQDGVGLVFVGDGAAKPAIQALARSCRRVRFLPFFPAEQIAYVLSAGDVHVVSIRRGLEGMVVPSKLYPILGAGRPVLAVAPEDSDVARIVVRGGCGLVADPDDPSSIAASIQMLLEKRERLKEMAERARRIASEFEDEGQLKRFMQEVDQVWESRRNQQKIYA